MKTLVINLDAAVERWDRFRQSSQVPESDVVRVSAVDGRALPDKWAHLSKWMHLTHEPSKFNIMPAIGCFLSHRKCWSRIVEDQLPYALVLEDDARASQLAGQFTSEYEAKAPAIDWLKLCVHRHRDRVDSQVDINLNIAGVELCVDMRGSKSTAAYIITNHGARKALGMTKILAPIDHLEWLHARQGLLFAQTRTNLFELDAEMESTISPQNTTSILRLPAIMRIGLVRCTIGRRQLKANLAAIRQAVASNSDATSIP